MTSARLNFKKRSTSFGDTEVVITTHHVRMISFCHPAARVTAGEEGGPNQGEPEGAGRILQHHRPAAVQRRPAGRGSRAASGRTDTLSDTRRPDWWVRMNCPLNLRRDMMRWGDVITPMVLEITRVQGCGIGVGVGVWVGRSRQIWPESESESVKICRLRLQLAYVGGSMVYVFDIYIFTERQPQLLRSDKLSDALW